MFTDRDAPIGLNYETTEIKIYYSTFKTKKL